MAQENIQVRVRAVGLDKDVANQARKGEKLAGPINLRLNEKGFSQPLGRITGQMGEFEKSMDAAVARVFAFGAAVGVINAISDALKGMAQSAIEVEKALQDINVVLGLSQQELENFGGNLMDIAADTATPFDSVTEAAVEFARQGLSAEETLQRINDAMILTRLSGLDAAQSVSALTAAINGFSTAAISSTDIINRLATVDAAFAVSSKDLADGLARAGATAQAAKVDFNELLAAVTSVQQQTARGGAVIGNSFKSIFTRLQRSGVQDALNEVGVATQNSDGSFRSAMAVLQDYARISSTLTDAQKAQTDELIAGVFQVNNLKALIKDLNSEYSIYGRALDTANSATDEAIQRNEQLNQTMDALLKRTGISIKELASSLGEMTLGPGIEKVLGIIKSIADAVNNVLDGDKGSDIAKGLINGIGSFISGPGLVIVGAAFMKLFAFIAKQGAGAIQSVFSLNKESQRQQGLQQAIGQILSSNEKIMKMMLSDSVSQADKERTILGILKQQTAERMRQDAFLKKMAGSSALANIGVGKSGFVGAYGKGVRAQKGREALGIFAEGYIPSFAKEQDAINKGVGGARKTAKPVLIKNFQTSKNTKQDVVANSDEYVVQNYMGTGASAIFNRDMVARFGLPEGSVQASSFASQASKQIYSIGYIPNFAKGKKNKDTLNMRAGGAGIVLPETGGSSPSSFQATYSAAQVLGGNKAPEGLKKIKISGMSVGRLQGENGSFDEIVDVETKSALQNIGRKVLGTNSIKPAGPLSDYLDKSAAPQVTGRLFEATLNYIKGAVVKGSPGTDTWDFPSGLGGRVSKAFGLESVSQVKMDSKTSLNKGGPSFVKKLIKDRGGESYLKSQGFDKPSQLDKDKKEKTKQTGLFGKIKNKIFNSADGFLPVEPESAKSEASSKVINAAQGFLPKYATLKKINSLEGSGNAVPDLMLNKGVVLEQQSQRQKFSNLESKAESLSRGKIPNFAFAKMTVESRLAQENFKSRLSRSMKEESQDFVRTKFDFDRVMVKYPNNIREKDLFEPDSINMGIPTPLAKKLGENPDPSARTVDIITARASDSIPSIKSKLEEMNLIPGKIVATGDMYKNLKINEKTGRIIDTSKPIPDDIELTAGGRPRGFRNLNSAEKKAEFLKRAWDARPKNKYKLIDDSAANISAVEALKNPNIFGERYVFKNQGGGFFDGIIPNFSKEESAKRNRVQLSDVEEKKFQKWWSENKNVIAWKKDLGAPNKSPDNKFEKFDYRKAWLAGDEPRINPEDNKYHWGSIGKDFDHPTYPGKEKAQGYTPNFAFDPKTIEEKMKQKMVVPQFLQETAKKVKSAGGSLQIVGGATRDFLIGKSPKDWDVEVFGLNKDKIQEILSPNLSKQGLVGKDFGVFKANSGGQEFEFSMPRRETRVGIGHKAFDVSIAPNMSREEAAKRRDLTINSISYDPIDGKFIDPLGGIDDLKNKTMRPTSNRFKEDPLRVLRSMQFAGRYDLKANSELLEYSRSMVNEFKSLPKERVRDEWMKWASKSTNPAAGLEFLKQSGWIKHFPEIDNLRNTPQSAKFHPEGNVFEHTKNVTQSMARDPAWQALDDKQRSKLMLSALTHDFGKVTHTQIQEAGKITSYGHDRAGVAPMKSFLGRIMSEGEAAKISKQIAPLVENHMFHANFNQNLTKRSIGRLSKKVGDLSELKILMQNDLSQNLPKEVVAREFTQQNQSDLNKFTEISKQLGVTNKPIQPLVQGRDLISAGLMQPGKDMGLVLEKLQDAQINQKFSTKEEGLKYFEKNRDSIIKSIIKTSSLQRVGSKLKPFKQTFSQGLIPNFALKFFKPNYVHTSKQGNDYILAKDLAVAKSDFPSVSFRQYKDMYFPNRNKSLTLPENFQSLQKIRFERPELMEDFGRFAAGKGFPEIAAAINKGIKIEEVSKGVASYNQRAYNRAAGTNKRFELPQELDISLIKSMKVDDFVSSPSGRIGADFERLYHSTSFDKVSDAKFIQQPIRQEEIINVFGKKKMVDRFDSKENIFKNIQSSRGVEQIDEKIINKLYKEFADSKKLNTGILNQGIVPNFIDIRKLQNYAKGGRGITKNQQAYANKLLSEKYKGSSFTVKGEFWRDEPLLRHYIKSNIEGKGSQLILDRIKQAGYSKKEISEIENLRQSYQAGNKNISIFNKDGSESKIINYDGYIPNFSMQDSRLQESFMASNLYNKPVSYADTHSTSLEVGGKSQRVVVNNREQVFNTGKDVQKAFGLPIAPDGGMVLPPPDTKAGKQRRTEFKSKTQGLLASGAVPNFSAAQAIKEKTKQVIQKTKSMPKEFAEQWKSSDFSGKIKMLAKYGLAGAALAIPGGGLAALGIMGAKKAWKLIQEKRTRNESMHNIESLSFGTVPNFQNLLYRNNSVKEFSESAKSNTIKKHSQNKTYSEYAGGLTSNFNHQELSVPSFALPSLFRKKQAALKYSGAPVSLNKESFSQHYQSLNKYITSSSPNPPQGLTKILSKSFEKSDFKKIKEAREFLQASPAGTSIQINGVPHFITGKLRVPAVQQENKLPPFDFRLLDGPPKMVDGIVPNLINKSISDNMVNVSSHASVPNFSRLMTNMYRGTQGATKGRVMQKEVPNKNIFNKQKILRFLNRGKQKNPDRYPQLEKLKESIETGSFEKWANANGGIFLNLDGAYNHASASKRFYQSKDFGQRKLFGQNMPSILPHSERSTGGGQTEKKKFMSREQEVMEVVGDGVIGKKDFAPMINPILKKAILKAEKPGDVVSSLQDFAVAHSLGTKYQGSSFAGTRDVGGGSGAVSWSTSTLPAKRFAGYKPFEQVDIEKLTRMVVEGVVPNFANNDFKSEGLDAKVNTKELNFTGSMQASEGRIPNFARYLSLEETFRRRKINQKKNLEKAKEDISPYKEMELTGDFDGILPIIKVTDPKTKTYTKFSYGKGEYDSSSSTNIIDTQRAPGVNLEDVSMKGGANRNFDIIAKFTGSQRWREKNINSSALNQVRGVSAGKTAWDKLLNSYPQIKQRAKEGMRTSGVLQLSTDVINFSSLSSLKRQTNAWANKNGMGVFDDLAEANLKLDRNNGIIGARESGDLFSLSELTTTILNKKDPAFLRDFKSVYSDGFIPNFAYGRFRNRPNVFVKRDFVYDPAGKKSWYTQLGGTTKHVDEFVQWLKLNKTDLVREKMITNSQFKKLDSQFAKEKESYEKSYWSQYNEIQSGNASRSSARGFYGTNATSARPLPGDEKTRLNITNPINELFIKKENMEKLIKRWKESTPFLSEGFVPNFVDAQTSAEDSVTMPSPPVPSRGLIQGENLEKQSFFEGIVPNFIFRESRVNEAISASKLYNQKVGYNDTRVERLEIGGKKENVVVNNKEKVFNTGKDVQKAFGLSKAPDGGMVLPPQSSGVGRERRNEFTKKVKGLAFEGIVPNFILTQPGINKQAGGRKKNKDFQNDPKNVIDLSPFTSTDYTMLLPKKRGGSTFDKKTRVSGPYANKYQTKFVVGWNVKGLHPQMGKNAETVARAADHAYGSIKEIITSYANTFVRTFGEPRLKGAPPEAINKAIQGNLNKGTLTAAAGVAFESAANVAFNNIPVNAGGGDFDVRGPSEQLRKFFNWPSSHGFIGDYKAASGKDTKTSMADKILKELDYSGLLSGQVQKKT